jgi:8-oxo-dGTP pyrophosphatase MutT (NUDIX family)
MINLERGSKFVRNKDGLLEAVMFVFQKDTNKILIENRLEKNPPETFIPNGKIEEKDKNGHQDYQITALKREIKEELGDDVNPENIIKLGEFKVEVIQVIFFIYLINKWSGELNETNYENGKKIAQFEWITTKEAMKRFDFPVLKYVLKILEGNNYVIRE